MYNIDHYQDKTDDLQTNAERYIRYLLDYIDNKPNLIATSKVYVIASTVAQIAHWARKVYGNITLVRVNNIRNVEGLPLDSTVVKLSGLQLTSNQYAAIAYLKRRGIQIWEYET